jgi:hypothetical protein
VCICEYLLVTWYCHHGIWSPFCSNLTLEVQTYDNMLLTHMFCLCFEGIGCVVCGIYACYVVCYGLERSEQVGVRAAMPPGGKLLRKVSACIFQDSVKRHSCTGGVDKHHLESFYLLRNMEKTALRSKVSPRTILRKILQRV